MDRPTPADLAALADEDLDRLAADLATERARRAAPATTTTFVLETGGAFDPRKHGHAYVAELIAEAGRQVGRRFLAGGARRWDTKRKTYEQSWEIELPIGSIIECRLSDGSWKNDYRKWAQVEADGPRPITQADAHDALFARD